MTISLPRILFAGFLVLWSVSLVWYGAVTAPSIALMAAGTAALWIESLFLLQERLRPTRSAIFAGAALVAIVLLQIVPLPFSLFPYTDALRARHGVAGRAPGTGDLYLTIRQLSQLGAYVLAGMFVKRLVDAGLKRMDVFTGVVAVLALQAVYAVLQVGFRFQEIPFYGLRPYADSASGTLVNRNSFAGMMAIGLVMAIAASWARFTSPRRLKMFSLLEGGLPWAIAAALFAACIVMSKSRGGSLGAVAGVLALPFLVRLRAAGTSVLAGALIIGLGVAAVLASDAEPLAERFESIDPDKVGTDTRVVCWKASLEAWRKQPVLGFGIGAFPEAFRPFQPAELPGQFDHAHSEYVNALFEGGVAWFGLLAVALALWLWHSLRGLRRLEGSERAAAGACIAAVLAIAVHSLVDFDLRITSVGLLFAVAIGAALPYHATVRPFPRYVGAFPAIAVIGITLPLWFADLEAEKPALRAAICEPAEAEVRLAAILRRSPYDAVASSLQALQAERREDLALAGDRLETATMLWPSNPLLQRDAALWYLEHDDLARADVCFRRAFEQRPSLVPETIALRWSHDPQVGPWIPRLPTPRSTAAFAALLARLNLWREAATVFENGVPAEDKYAKDYDNLADSFLRAGQWGLEAEIRERRIALRSDPEAHALAAAAWSRLEVWDNALEHARLAIRVDPGRADWWATLGAILDAKGDSLGAIEAFTEAVRIKPDDLALRMKRGEVYTKDKLYMLAQDDYRFVVKADPKNRDGMVGLAKSLLECGKKADALEVLEAWMLRNPDDVLVARELNQLKKDGKR
jgi:O-antigen ligase/Flp pilus assembly protein TadD